MLKSLKRSHKAAYLQHCATDDPYAVVHNN